MFWVEYAIYFLDLGAEQTHMQLEMRAFALEQETRKITEGYLWFQDEIYFEIKNHPSNPTLSSLVGKVSIGESMDDELFICHVLFQLSRLFPNIVVKISDSDGEFLLIEASDQLPAWLTRRNFADRVIIHDGEIKIIPHSVKKGAHSMLQAVGQGNFVRCVEIQDAIAGKLAVFQDKNYNIHYCKCRIPKRCAQILYQEPRLVSLSINALIEHETTGNSHSSSDQHAIVDDYVSTTVKFTRLQYARLLCFPLDNISPTLISSLPQRNSPHYKESELGAKLSYGFQLAMRDFVPFNRLIVVDEKEINEIRQQFPSASTEYIADFLKSIRTFPIISDKSQLRRSAFHSLHCSFDDSAPYFVDIPDSDETWLQDIQNESFDAIEEQEQTNELEKMLNDFQKHLSTNLHEDGSDFEDGEDELQNNESIQCNDIQTDIEESEFSENEFEVLETLINNPDLLMKIIEKNCQMGADSHNQLLIDQLNCIKELIPKNEEENEPGDADEWSDQVEDVDLFEYMRSYDEELEHLDIDKQTTIQ